MGVYSYFGNYWRESWTNLTFRYRRFAQTIQNHYFEDIDIDIDIVSIYTTLFFRLIFLTDFIFKMYYYFSNPINLYLLFSIQIIDYLNDFCLFFILTRF